MISRRDFLKAVSVAPLMNGLPDTDLTSNEARLRAACLEGLKNRKAMTVDVSVEKIDQELATIHQLGLDEGFLVLAALASRCRQKDLLLHLRGPANGSRVIYALGLSQVLPQRGLLFERFIDLNNQKVYVVLESDPGQAAQVRKIVHELLGIKFEVKDWGVRVSWGRQNGNAEPRLEIDIVKHPDVGTLCRALTMVNPSADRQLILEQLPENDPETLALLSRGETEGVSLFCSEGMQDFLRQLKPVNFEDLAAAYALYRPGPLESGLAQAYLDRDSSNRWPEFPGGGRFLIYQENVMHLFQAAGMSLSDSRRFQKAWCMRKRAEADLLLAAFTQNAKKQGLSEGWALGFVDVLKRYTHHAFCKAHAAGDANLGYQMAFIKAHYPEEFEEARKQTRQNENGAQPE